MSSFIVKPTHQKFSTTSSRVNASSSQACLQFQGCFFFTLLALALMLALGCGGGYPGTGIIGLSASSVILDGGQSFAVTAN
ncbi:MAG: hypothetical protein ABI142_10220, partial [Bryocella sp.]